MRLVLGLLALLLFAYPAEAATNGRILFTSANRIQTVDPAGGAWTRLVADETRQGQAAWSPDGQRVAFRVGPDGDSEIWVVGADGSGAHAITDTPNDPSGATAAEQQRFSSQPSWSPDGRRIVFRSDRRANNADVYSMNADGTDVRPLVTDDGDERYPSLSPDGTRLVFRTDLDGDPEVWVAGADGSNAVQLTHDDVFTSAPSWSRDGTRIAFERGDAGADVTTNASYPTMEIWSMAAGGGDERQLTSNGVHDEGPVYAPDNSGALVFTRDDKTNSDIWVREADGRERRLTDAASLEESPDWQPVPDAATAPSPPQPEPGVGTAERIVGRPSLVSRRVRASRTGRVAVRVRCGAACSGTLVLSRGGRTLGRARFSAPSARTITVRVRLTPSALRRLRRARTLAADVRLLRGRITLLRPR